MVPGFVRVSVKGQQCQRFVNLCRGREMDLKRIIRTGETELQLTMNLFRCEMNKTEHTHR